MNPDNYRYKLAEDDMLVPTITTKDVIPDDIPVLRNFLKCAKRNACPCGVKLIGCCKFCKYKSFSTCNNTFY